MNWRLYSVWRYARRGWAHQGRPVLDRAFDTPPALTDRERLMRHSGRPECTIAEHGDAFREVGRVRNQLDEAQAARVEYWAQACRARRDAGELAKKVALLEAANASLARQVEYWQSRAHHPSNGEQAA